MNRRKILAIVATAVTLSTSGVMLLGASADEKTEPERLIFRDETTASTFVDINHNGAPDAGDSFVFHEVFKKDHSVVEYNDSQCLIGFSDQFLCHVVVVVNGRGQIVIDGSVAAPGGAFPADFDLAVTGGTGDFATARGYVRAHHVSDTVSRDTVFLLP